MKVNKKPVHVIQAFCNSYEYDKLFKDFDSRKAYVQWKQQIPSETIIARDSSEVFIHENYFGQPAGKLEDLLIITDYNITSYEDYLNLLLINNESIDPELNYDNYQKYLQQRQHVWVGKLSPAFKAWKIFTIRMEEAIELYLNWNYWTVGEPKRENFKLAELRTNQPVHVIMDGKRDFSLTGRRKRTFIENNYIIEYKGCFQDIIITENKVSSTKEIPTNTKEINLLKHIK